VLTFELGRARLPVRRDCDGGDLGRSSLEHMEDFTGVRCAKKVQSGSVASLAVREGGADSVDHFKVTDSFSDDLGAMAAAARAFNPIKGDDCDL
jgi:hypothetical protein